ncbi:MAG: beta-ketoacyl synthase N-terminal-like domain-containing protein [Woeseiaceae bacterium]|jgi:acetyl-CoA acyltransferase
MFEAFICDAVRTPIGRYGGALSGLPVTVPAVTVNRLCGSGMNAIGNIADSIRTGAIRLGIAGGVESMSRAPFVMPKQSAAFCRNTELYDTPLGWHFAPCASAWGRASP